MDLEQLLQKKAAADLNWDRVATQVFSGIQVDKRIIEDAMNACNSIDQQIEDIKFKIYLKKREEWLIDCDISCGDAAIDDWHQKLREQYQQIYGKDIKHG